MLGTTKMNNTWKQQKHSIDYCKKFVYYATELSIEDKLDGGNIKQDLISSEELLAVLFSDKP